MLFRNLSKSFFILILTLTTVACGEKSGQEQGGSPTPRQYGTNCSESTAPDAAKVIASVDGVNITEGDISDIIKSRMRRVEQDIYDIKADALESLIDQKLLEKAAEEKNSNVGKLLKDEVYSKIAAITDQDVKDFYEENKMRFGKQAFEQVKAKIQTQMTGYLKQQAKADYLDGLREKHKVQISIEPPRVQEVKVAANDPTIGDDNAPIQIVEFSEFQCPFCKRTRPTVSQILKEYKGKIQYVFRDYPLGFHQHAKSAANAAHCAGDQGKYWPYNEALFENQSNLSKSGYFSEVAKKLGLDMKAFEACQSSNKYFADIDADQQEGSEMGVSGTPAFFVNGIFLSGAQPFEKFKAIIESELSRKK